MSIFVGGVELLTVAGLGGTFAPTWYETAAADLPHPKKSSARATELADKRRHFVREEVEACRALRGVDIFMTHEAPKPFRPFPGGRGPDAGKVQVNEILAAMRPRLHLFGHHHRFSEQTIEGVRSVGLDLVIRSYLLIDVRTMGYELREYNN
jgi:Icc-related predicted phosphoesterase